MQATPLSTLVPLLIVRDAERACEFYVSALGATELARYVNKQRGVISNTDFSLGNSSFESSSRSSTACPSKKSGSAET
jgi:uncharacterized glyoxalase superfamily protein PhnB